MQLLKITNIKLSPTWEEYGLSARTDNLILWLANLPIESTSASLGQCGFSSRGRRQEFGCRSGVALLFTRVTEHGSYPNKGGLGYTMLLNMFGSALGLEQAHLGFPGVTSASDPGPLGLNQAPFTVMSANWSYQGFGDVLGRWGSMKTFGAFDIAALQKIYGANMTTATGNDVYTLPTGIMVPTISGSDTGTGWTCIWDTGGTDTISGGTRFQSVTIDLRAATLATAIRMRALLSATDVAGGFTSPMASSSRTRSAATATTR